MKNDTGSAATTNDLLTVYMTVFVDMVAFAVILPALPFWAMRMGAGGLWLGVLLTSYSGAKLVGAALAGRASDAWGRKPVLVACLAGSGVSFVLTGLAPSLLTLAGARAVAGLFGGTVATAQAYIADVTRPAERAKYMGLLGAAIGTGFIVGPGLGVGLSQFGFLVVTLVAAALAFGNAVLAMIRVRETQPAGPAAVDSEARAGGRRGAFFVLTAMFLIIFAFVSMETTLAFVARDRYVIAERGFGLILVFVGVIMIIVQGGLVGRLVPKHGERRLAGYGALLLGTSLALLPLAPGLATTMLLLGLLAFGQGLASPTLSTLLSRYSVRDEQGGMLGIGQSTASAARTIAPITAGWLYDQGAPWPFLLAGVMALIAALAVNRSPHVEVAEVGGPVAPR